MLKVEGRKISPGRGTPMLGWHQAGPDGTGLIQG
jgi:hypothetical protein